MEVFGHFLSKNALYIVLIIVLLVWTGIFGYLLSIDKRLKQIEQETKNEK